MNIGFFCMCTCLRFPQCSAQMSGSLLFPPWPASAVFVAVCPLWATASLSSTRRLYTEQMGRECVSRGCNLSDTQVTMTYGATRVIVMSVRLASLPCHAARQIQQVGMVQDCEKPERERKATNTHTHTHTHTQTHGEKLIWTLSRWDHLTMAVHYLSVQ